MVSADRSPSDLSGVWHSEMVADDQAIGTTLNNPAVL